MKCGKEISDSERELCYDCADGEKPFDAGVAVFNYDETAAKSMVMFKYKGRREYARFYAQELLRDRGDEIKRFVPQLIIPVPIHKTRLEKRGYNQASEIARHVGKALNVPVRDDILIRHKKTNAQKELNASQRQKNIAQAMKVTCDLSGFESILIIDDIYTTGSTLSACARALKAAGAKRVYCASICIGKDA